jgi:hypothetical protein
MYLSFSKTSKSPAVSSPVGRTSYSHHKPKGTDDNSAGDNPLPAWKKSSLELREALKAGKKPAFAPGAGDPLPDSIPSKVPSSYVTCPTCNRRFNEHAAARHIPQCKNIIAKPSVLKKGQGGGGGLQGSSAKTNAIGIMR